MTLRIPSIEHHSNSSLLLDSLSDEQQRRLIGLLDSYMIDAEEGKLQDVESIIARHPDLATPLRDYLEGLHWLRRYRENELMTPVSRPFPTTLGDYEMGEELGRGAMGVVYDAKNVSSGESVAIKVLSFGSVADSSRIERFRREALAAESLNHPNIVPVLDIGVQIGLHYYVMKRIDGASLARRIDTAERIRHAGPDTAFDLATRTLAKPLLDESRYSDLARQFARVAEAMHTAHLSGIVHRDIKPSNLLMDLENRIWITDFGLAHIEDGSQLTRSGDLVGTFHYMSPEQASGRPERVDRRTDIYSLGASLYEIFAGYPPFSGWEGNALLKQIQSAVPPRLKRADPNLPRDLETIIGRAMRPDKADRYATALDMGEDLQRFAEGKRILAKPVGIAERVTRTTAKHASAVALGLILCIVSLVALSAHSLILQGEKARTAAALERAEHNYRNARDVVDTLGSQMAERLMLIPGTESLRREVLAESLAYYRAFIESSNSDPRLATDVAQTHLKIARLIAQAGNTADTQKVYRDAVESLREAFAASHAPSIMLSLNRALNEWAMIVSQQGDQKAAVEHLRNSLQILDGYPPGRQRVTAEALSHNSLAIVAIREDDTATALLESQRAVELLESIPKEVSENDSDHETEAALADSLSNLSVMLAAAGNSESAADIASKVVRIKQSLANKTSSPDSMRRLALAYNNLAALDWRQGRVNEALASYREGIGLLERVVHQMPGQRDAQRELSVTLNNLGMAYTSTKNWKEAEQSFRRALAIANPAADADVKNVEAAQRTAGIWNNLGVLFKDQNDKMRAGEAFERAGYYQRRACDSAPKNATHPQVLDQILKNLASLNAK